MILSAPKQKTATTKQRIELSKDNVEILAEIAGIDGTHWQLCLHPLERDANEWDALQTLADNAKGINPFYEPTFLKAMRGRLIRKNDNHLIMWEISAEQKIAKIAYPAKMGKTKNKSRVISAYQNEYAPIATPLLDNKDTAETMSRFGQLIDASIKEHGVVFRIENMCKNSPFAIALSQHKKELKSSIIIEDTQTRSALYAKNKNAAGLSGLSKKRERELKRLSKKINELGELKYERVTSMMDVLTRFEEFLLLETQGWKGRKGSSMQLIKKAAAFARQATTEFAKEGKCEIYSMRLNGRAIAILINFYINGRSYPWKITYDEEYAHRSPGSVLMYQASLDLLERPDFVMADSLAKSGKSWVSNIWHDTTSFSHVVIASSDEIAKKVLKQKPLKQRLKEFAKLLLRRS